MDQGAFDGKHSFELIPLDDQKTRFIQKETIAGFLVPLFKKKLRETEELFKKMNVALKLQVEENRV